MEASVNVCQLQQLLAAGSVRLLDVLLPEDFASRHIAGAENACVYEMAFLERVLECVPDHAMTIVVYDDSGTTLAAQTAKEKLERAGYFNVTILAGGLQAWRAAGLAVESHTLEPLPDVLHDGVYGINAEKSVVEWVGRNINSRHHGRISIASGDVVIKGARPVSGHVVLDMDTLSNLDLQDEGWRGLLLQHLKSEDFFDVKRYPTVSFKLLGAAAIAGATPGTPNWELAGSLTIKDATRSLSFSAVIAAQADGTIKAQASLDLDRTLWNVCYGSGKLFERLGMHVVNDVISVDLFIVTHAR